MLHFTWLYTPTVALADTVVNAATVKKILHCNIDRGLELSKAYNLVDSYIGKYQHVSVNEDAGSYYKSYKPSDNVQCESKNTP